MNPIPRTVRVDVQLRPGHLARWLGLHLLAGAAVGTGIVAALAVGITLLAHLA